VTQLKWEQILRTVDCLGHNTVKRCQKYEKKDAERWRVNSCMHCEISRKSVPLGIDPEHER